MPDDTQNGDAGGTGDAGTTTTSTQTPPRWDHEIFDPATPGKLKEKWQDSLPDEFAEHRAMLANYGDFGTFIKSHKDLMRLARQNGGVKPITAESTPEEIADFRKAMAIPEAPYEFKKPDELPEGVQWVDDRAKAYGKWAHERNLSPAQAKEGLDLYMQFLSEDAKVQTQKYETYVGEQKQKLKEQYGGALPTAVILAQRAAAKESIPPSAVDPDSPDFQGPLFLKLAKAYGEALGETQLPSHASVLNDSPLTKYQSITGDKTNPKNALWAKGDKAVVAEANALLKEAGRQGLIK
jgi:hypothetical protein